MLRMIEVNICGIRPYTFKDNGGNEIKMEQLFATYSDKYINGTGALSFSVTAKKSVEDALDVGKNVRVAFADKKWQYVGAI